MVRTSQPMPRSRAMTRHAASGLAFMAMACLGGRGSVRERVHARCAMCQRSGRPGCWHGSGCYGRWFERRSACVAVGGKAALMLPRVALSWSRS